MAKKTQKKDEKKNEKPKQGAGTPPKKNSNAAPSAAPSGASQKPSSSTGSKGGSKSNKQGKKKEKREARAVETKIDAQRERDQERAIEESSRFYADGALGRLEAGERLKDVEQAGSIERIAEPGKIDRVGYQGNIERVSTQMPGAEQSLAEAQNHYQKAQQRDAYVESALQRMQAGLGGYTAPENQALRAQLSRATRGQTATALRQLRRYQGENQVTGNSASAQAMGILTSAASDRAMQETDILAKNVEEQRLRQGLFANAANAADSTLRSDRDSALGRLLGVRGDIATYQQTGEKLNQDASAKDIANRMTVDKANQDASAMDVSNALDVASKNQIASQQDIANRMAVNARNQETQKYNIENDRNRALYNLEQQQAELGARAGTYYGDLASIAAQRAAIDNQRIAREQLRIASRGVQ